MCDFDIDESDMICGNCQHWDTRNMIAVTVADSGPFGRISRKLSPCAVNSIEMDAGTGGIAMLGPDCHCLNHAAAFEPRQEFLDELAERDTPLDGMYGITPGVDCPATLNPSSRYAA